MREELRVKIIKVCDKQIASKGDGVGVSFYAFFANRNDDPESLMETATWWIKTHKLDHFVKARVIREMVQSGLWLYTIRDLVLTYNSPLSQGFAVYRRFQKVRLNHPIAFITPMRSGAFLVRYCFCRVWW